MQRLEAEAAALILRALGDVLDTLARNLGAVVQAAAGPGEARTNPDDLANIRTGWQAAVDQQVAPYFQAVYLAGGQQALQQVEALGGVLAAPDPALVDQAAAEYLAASRQRFYGLGDEVWSAARAALLEGFQAGEGIDALRRRVQAATDLARVQAEALARTEVISASNAGAMAHVRMLGDAAPASKQWVATMDARTRPTHLHADGQIVPLRQPFTVGFASLQYPGDPTGPAGEVMNCRCTVVFTEGASVVDVDGRQQGGLPDVVPGLVADAGPAQVDTTSGEPHTGSMIALVPADPEAWALEGGEPADALHVTLAFLGEAADVPPGAADMLMAHYADVAQHMAPVEGIVFGAAAWNTAGDHPCLVASVGGEAVDGAHTWAWAALGSAMDYTGWAPPEQHAPWAAHMCLAYTPDAPALVPAASALEGPITFDRIRFTMGADAYDYPLTGAPTVEASSMPQPIVINIGTGTTAGGPLAVPRFAQGGTVRPRLTAPPRLTPPAAIVVDALTAAAPSGKPVTGAPEEPQDGYAALPPTPAAQAGEHIRALMAVEGVSTGFRTLTNLDVRPVPFAFNWQRSSSAHGGTPEVVQVGNVVRTERNGAEVWGFIKLDLGSVDGQEYARRSVAGFERWVSVGLDETVGTTTVVWPDEPPPEMPVDGTLPTEEVLYEPQQLIIDGGRVGELTAVAVPALAEALSEPTQELIDLMPDAAPAQPMPMAASAAHSDCGCGGTCADCGGHEPSAADAVQAITAAATTIVVRENPPAAWYQEPQDVPMAGAFNVTDHGRVYGLLAPLGTGHRAYAHPGARRLEVPWGNVDYTRFMGAWALTDKGKIAAGPVTMDCGHAARYRANGDVAPAHYDNSCSCIATIAVGESRRLGGVWAAGALLPGVTPEHVARALACRFSGDWQPHPDKAGWRELIAALLVPSPGFGTAHASATYDAEGALVASSAPVRYVGHQAPAHTPMAALVRLAADSAGRSPAARVLAATRPAD